MRVLVIEKAAVKQNIRVVKRRAGGAAVYGVLSGDAGGAGIAEMRWLPKGHTVGAEKTAVLKAPTRVAVVPVGYQHGFGVERPRPAGLLGTLGRWRRGRRLYVRVNGQRARVIGSVGVSETLVDVTDLKCSAGDVVSFDLDPMYARGCVRQYR